jgi:DNA-binding beta-propeller fold protein YncE
MPIRFSVLALFLPASLAAQTLAVAFPEQQRVLLFDTRTYDSVASVAVGRAPHEIAVAPDGRSFYVGNTATSGTPERLTVTRVDFADSVRTSTIDAGDCAGLHDLRVSRSGRLLWLGCARVPAVAEIELPAGTLRRQWPMTLDGGWMLAASPDDRRIFVAHLEGQGLTAIDRERDAVTVMPGPGPEYGVAVTPAGGEIWVTAPDSSRVTVLDREGDSVLATFPGAGKGPGRLGFTSKGRLAAIVHDEPASLTLVDVASRRVAASIPLAAGPKVLALSPDGRFAAVSHPDAKLVSIVDLERRAVVRTIAVPSTPDGVAFVAAKAPRRGPRTAADKGR